MLARLETLQHILVVEAVRRGDIDDVHVVILQHLSIRAVRRGLLRRVAQRQVVVDEGLGARGGGGGGDGDDAVLDVGDVARRRVEEQVARKRAGDAGARRKGQSCERGAAGRPRTRRWRGCPSCR
jgi:hypothetical protein